jgi:hypothetical protein
MKMAIWTMFFNDSLKISSSKIRGNTYGIFAQITATEAGKFTYQNTTKFFKNQKFNNIDNWSKFYE